VAPDRVLQKRNRKWLYTIAAIWTASFLLIATAGIYVIIKAQHINNELCSVSQDNRNILSKILDTAQRQSLENTESILGRNIVRQRFNELRAVIPPLTCAGQGGPKELES
jgi:hypothetical protein